MSAIPAESLANIESHAATDAISLPLRLTATSPFHHALPARRWWRAFSWALWVAIHNSVAVLLAAYVLVQARAWRLRCTTASLVGRAPHPSDIRSEVWLESSDVMRGGA